MEVQIIRSGDIWQFNPAVEGYSSDAPFHPITGTPAISSGKLRLNKDEIITYDKKFLFGSLEVLATIPAAPTAGDIRQIGFKNNDDKGKMVFDITDDVFTAQVYDRAGTLVKSKTINWDSAWTAAEARYRIVWSERSVYFVINDVIVARIEDGFDRDIGDSVQTMKQPIAVYLKNTNADNLDVSLINFF